MFASLIIVVVSAGLEQTTDYKISQLIKRQKSNYKRIDNVLSPLKHKSKKLGSKFFQ
jgi:hypothetical protein